jgi:hypothetical protein
LKGDDGDWETAIQMHVALSPQRPPSSESRKRFAAVFIAYRYRYRLSPEWLAVAVASCGAWRIAVHMTYGGNMGLALSCEAVRACACAHNGIAYAYATGG